MRWHEDKYLQENRRDGLPPKHCKGLNGMVAVPFEDLLKALLEPQLHIEGQLNHIAGAEKQIKVYKPKIWFKGNLSPNFHSNFSSPGQWNTPRGVWMCSCHIVYPNKSMTLIDHLKIRTWRMVWESVNQEASFRRGKYTYTCHSQ